MFLYNLSFYLFIVGQDVEQKRKKLATILDKFILLLLRQYQGGQYV